MDSPNTSVALGLALLLGLRHATDPDHVVAVSTLVAGTDEQPSRAAARLGALWGTGHALALFVLGLPVVLAHAVLPEPVQRVAETAIGCIIVMLAIRLLMRWRDGGYHVHDHDHHDHGHRHFHAHAGENDDHEHAHVEPRTPLQAFLIGATHGIGGSAAVALLLLASIESRTWAAVALLIFAAGTALSMTLLSGAWGWLLGTRHVRTRFRAAVLPLGLCGLFFGVLYAVAAWVPGIPVV
jgi:ABC-type nickel/cobalt efflux system permease component RcnA